MSTESASQNTAHPNHQDNSYNLLVTPMKRKRGRPRKDGRPRKEEVTGSQLNKRIKPCTVRRRPISDDCLVGREVSCSFTGVFDAGYLLTVQVGSSGPILTGLVFDPRLFIPVSAENDIAPHLPMLGRNGFSSPVEEGFIHQGADSSQACIAQKTGLIQPIQAKESPTTSFTSRAQTDLQLNMIEVKPSQSSHVPQTITETMEPQYVPKTTNVFVEAAAIETSDQSPLSFSCNPEPRAKSEHAPISAGLSNISMEAASASKPSNGYNPSVFPIVTSSEVFKPSNVSDPSEAPGAVTNASSEPLNISKEALPTTEASNDVIFNISKTSDISKEEASVVFKPLEASANGLKISSAVSEEVVSRYVAFEATQVLEHHTLKTEGIAVDKLSSEQSLQRAEEEEASEDQQIDESFGDGESTGRPAGSE